MTEPRGITLADGVLEATFLPDLGMLGVSLRHRGVELLALPSGLDGYASGHVTGLPLLAPWANRLGARRYEADGVVVDLEDLALLTDDRGLPMHGTMSAQAGWQVVAVDGRSHTCRFDFGARPDLLASFPFPHEIRIDLDVDTETLTVITTLVPTADRRVPVSFGYHPYFRIADCSREAARLGLPERLHLELDERQLPTGDTRTESAEDEPLGARVFDDLYEPVHGCELSLTGAGHRLVLTLHEGYRYAQVYSPEGAGYVCLEPMTASVNALVDGSCALVQPGTRFSARFSVHVEEVPR